MITQIMIARNRNVGITFILEDDSLRVVSFFSFFRLFVGQGNEEEVEFKQRVFRVVRG